MTITLEINPQDEAQALRELTNDLRGLVKLKMKRPHVTAADIVAAGRFLNVFDEVEAQLPAPVAQPEASVAVAMVGGVA